MYKRTKIILLFIFIFQTTNLLKAKDFALVDCEYKKHFIQHTYYYITTKAYLIYDTTKFDSNFISINSNELITNKIGNNYYELYIDKIVDTSKIYVNYKSIIVDSIILSNLYFRFSFYPIGMGDVHLEEATQIKDLVYEREYDCISEKFKMTDYTYSIYDTLMKLKWTYKFKKHHHALLNKNDYIRIKNNFDNLSYLIIENITIITNTNRQLLIPKIICFYPGSIKSDFKTYKRFFVQNQNHYFYKLVY